MSSLKMTLPILALCLLLSITTQVLGKPSPKHLLIETEEQAKKTSGSNEDYQSWWPNYQTWGVSNTNTNTRTDTFNTQRDTFNTQRDTIGRDNVGRDNRSHNGNNRNNRNSNCVKFCFR